MTEPRCPVCHSTRCLAGQEYAPGKRYGQRWADGPMAVAHALWRDDRTPPAGPDELPGVVALPVTPGQPVTDSPVTDAAVTDNSAALVTDNLRPCEECGTPFEPRRTDARYCSPTCRQHAHRRDTTPEAP